MVFGLGPFEQVELDEPRHAIEIGIAAQPYFLESFFSTSLHTKPTSFLLIAKVKSSLATAIGFSKSRCHQSSTACVDQSYSPLIVTVSIFGILPPGIALLRT
jgi:hypothetical protein